MNRILSALSLSLVVLLAACGEAEEVREPEGSAAVESERDAPAPGEQATQAAWFSEVEVSGADLLAPQSEADEADAQIHVEMDGEVCERLGSSPADLDGVRAAITEMADQTCIALYDREVDLVEQGPLLDLAHGGSCAIDARIVCLIGWEEYDSEAAKL